MFSYYRIFAAQFLIHAGKQIIRQAHELHRSRPLKRYSADT